MRRAGLGNESNAQLLFFLAFNDLAIYRSLLLLAAKSPGLSGDGDFHDFVPLKSSSWSSLVGLAGEGGPGTYVASGYSVYEEENERLQEGLKAKVNVLKSVSDCLW